MPPNRTVAFSIEDDSSTAASVQPIKLVVEETLLEQQHEQFQPRLEQHTHFGTPPPTTTGTDYWHWVAFTNKNTHDHQDNVQPENESSTGLHIEFLFTIDYIEAKLVQEAAVRSQEQANKEYDETVVVIAVNVDDSSLSDSSYWDMPTDHEQQALTWVIENNQALKTCHAPRHRPLNHHHAAPAGMDVNAYWNDSGNNNQNENDYWNDPSHSHYYYYSVKISASQNQAKMTRPAMMTRPHYGAASPVNELDMIMIPYWDEAALSTDAAAYWIDPAASHDKLSYWDWPMVSLYYFDEDDDEPMQAELQAPGCSMMQNDSYWLF
jgi:hypothetical protein